jgi:hypothetical protein
VLPPEIVGIWEVPGGYILGLTLPWAFHRRAHETSVRRNLATVFRHVSVAGALALTGFACVALATGLVGTFTGCVEQALSVVITYYFGSRVIAH